MLFAKIIGLVKILKYFLLEVVLWAPIAFVMNGTEGVRILHADFVNYYNYVWNRIYENELKDKIVAFRDTSKVFKHFRIEVPLEYNQYPDEIVVKVKKGEIAMRKDSFSQYNSTIFYTVYDESSQFFGVTLTYEDLVRLGASISKVGYSN